jgi:transposase
VGKRIKGRKRHIVTDTIELLVGLVVHSVGIQDRDGAPDVLKAIVSRYPTLRHVFADGGYAGPKLRDALKDLGRWTFQIVKRSNTAEGFEVLPHRWVVERTFAWLNRCCRLSKDWEKSIASVEAWILIAHMRRVTRHIAKN